jgi:hypothetical protein
MKRCPQCLFIYPESDQRCDFDNTALVAVNDSEIDGPTKPRRNKHRFLSIAVAVVVALAAFAFYYVFKTQSNEEQTSTNIPVAPLPVAPPTPSPSPGISPSPSPSPTPKPSPIRTATSHTTSSLNPVSTGGPATGTKRGGKPVILLTDGGKIDADEVWRTRDGIWYRRNGIVTLLKHGRVRSIVNH